MTPPDAKIKKAAVESKRALQFMQEQLDAMEHATKTDGTVFMGWVARYIVTSSDPLPDPQDPIEKLAKQTVDVYRLVARLNAMIDVHELEIVVHGARPPAKFQHSAILGYQLGRINGLLGVCWEDAMAPAGARAFLAPHYLKALNNCVKHNASAWELMLQYATSQD